MWDKLFALSRKGICHMNSSFWWARTNRTNEFRLRMREEIGISKWKRIKQMPNKVKNVSMRIRNESHSFRLCLTKRLTSILWITTPRQSIHEIVVWLMNSIRHGISAMKHLQRYIFFVFIRHCTESIIKCYRRQCALLRAIDWHIQFKHEITFVSCKNYAIASEGKERHY